MYYLTIIDDSGRTGSYLDVSSASAGQAVGECAARLGVPAWRIAVEQV